MDPIDFIWDKLTHKLECEMDLLPVNDNVSCYCCSRPSGSWLCKSVKYRVDNYLKFQVPVCAACNALFHGSFEQLGAERGTQEDPTAAGKLGMLVGCGLIVTPTESILLANPGWYKRLNWATSPLCRIENISGKEADTFAETYVRSANTKQFPLLYITNLGRRKLELINSLAFTMTSDVLVCCAADSTTRLNLKLIDRMRGMLKEDKPTWDKLKKFIEASCRGFIRPDDKELRHFLIKSPSALSIAKVLPVDPHEKLSLLKAV